MKISVDDTAHYEHSVALATQLVKDTFEVLEQYGAFSESQREELAKDLLFRICAVLDGSSYPGALNGEPVAPFVGFYLAGQTEDVLVPEDGSAMHEFIGDLIESYHSQGGGGT